MCIRDSSFNQKRCTAVDTVSGKNAAIGAKSKDFSSKFGREVPIAVFRLRFRIKIMCHTFSIIAKPG